MKKRKKKKRPPSFTSRPFLRVNKGKEGKGGVWSRTYRFGRQKDIKRPVALHRQKRGGRKEKPARFGSPQSIPTGGPATTTVGQGRHQKRERGKGRGSLPVPCPANSSITQPHQPQKKKKKKGKKGSLCASTYLQGGAPEITDLVTTTSEKGGGGGGGKKKDPSLQSLFGNRETLKVGNRTPVSEIHRKEGEGKKGRRRKEKLLNSWQNISKYFGKRI